MKITYSNTARDTLASLTYTLLLRPVMFLYVLGFMALFSYRDIFPNIPPDASKSSQISYVIIHEGLFASLFIGVFIVFVLFLSIPFPRKNKTPNPRLTLTLGEDFFVVEFPASRLEGKWEVVKKLVRWRGYIFLHTRGSVFIIPRRAFDSQSQWDEFYEFCRRKCGGSAP